MEELLNIPGYLFIIYNLFPRMTDDENVDGSASLCFNNDG